MNAPDTLADPNASLVVRDLHKSFGAVEVLKGVSLKACEGDVISLLGSSGSGKSTFLRCINLLETPTSGLISVHGEDIKMTKDRHGTSRPSDPRQVKRIRARLALVFQSFNLWSHMTVLENVIAGPIHVLKQPRAEAIEHAKEMLQRVGMYERRDYYPAHISGGPFSQKEADGTLSGFDIDIALALCEQLNRECELVEQEWDGMIPALIARKYDAIVASMSITEDRKKRVDFSAKYYDTPSRFVAKDGADFDMTGTLEGVKIGVLRGTTLQCHVEKTYPEADLRLYNTQEDVFADLVTGRLDMQLNNTLQAIDGFLNTDQGQGFAFLGENVDDADCLGEGTGIAVRKGDPLAAELSEAIKAIRADGTYAAINDKYFDVDIYGK